MKRKNYTNHLIALGTFLGEKYAHNVTHSTTHNMRFEELSKAQLYMEITNALRNFKENYDDILSVDQSLWGEESQYSEIWAGVLWSAHHAKYLISLFDKKFGPNSKFDEVKPTLQKAMSLANEYGGPDVSELG